MMEVARGLALCGLVAVAAPAAGHEVQANRLTLVLRDRNHLTLTYLIDYPGALHQAIAPALSYREFIVMHSAMPPAEFQRALERAHERLQAGTRLRLASGDLAITAWKWPSAERAQGLLREVAMAAIVTPLDRPHVPPVEIRAEAVARQDIAALDVLLPAQLRDVLVVSYRVTQAVVRPDGRSTRVRF